MQNSGLFSRPPCKKRTFRRNREENTHTSPPPPCLPAHNLDDPDLWISLVPVLGYVVKNQPKVPSLPRENRRRAHRLGIHIRIPHSDQGQRHRLLLGNRIP